MIHNGFHLHFMISLMKPLKYLIQYKIIQLFTSEVKCLHLTYIYIYIYVYASVKKISIFTPSLFFFSLSLFLSHYHILKDYKD